MNLTSTLDYSLHQVLDYIFYDCFCDFLQTNNDLLLLQLFLGPRVPPAGE